MYKFKSHIYCDSLVNGKQEVEGDVKQCLGIVDHNISISEDVEIKDEPLEDNQMLFQIKKEKQKVKESIIISKQNPKVYAELDNEKKVSHKIFHKSINEDVNLQIKEEVETNSSNNSNIVGHMKTQSMQNPYPCSFCNTSFKNKTDLVFHLRTHTGEKYPCSLCKKAFSDNSSLITHLMTHSYSENNPYQCNYCTKAFAGKYRLGVHMSLFHKGKSSNKKIYQCSKCEKVFSHNIRLVIHFRIHTGEKPFQCSHCERKFSSKNNLTNHLRSHTHEKPYKCSHCDKAFKSKKSRKSHLRIHGRSVSGELGLIISGPKY